MSQATLFAILSGAMSACWFVLAWRALTLINFVGLKKGTASYWFVIALFVVFGISAGLQAVGLQTT